MCYLFMPTTAQILVFCPANSHTTQPQTLCSIRTAAHTNIGKLSMKEPVYVEERGSGEFLISSNSNSGEFTKLF